MKKKTYMGITLGVSVALLSACSNNVESAANELNDRHSELVTQLNELFEEERSLQDAFEETLANDPELHTFEDGSSPVFTNIEQRFDTIESLEDIRTNTENTAENFVDYEGEDEEVSTEDVQSLGSNFMTFTENLDQFTSSYAASLENQENYFTEIASDEADFETLSNGMSQINDEHSSLQEASVQLNEQLEELGEQLNGLDQTLESEVASVEGSSNEQIIEEGEDQELQEFTYEVDSSTWTIQPIDESADPEVVLLTFDDAPDDYSLEIAQILEEKDAPAIFFVNGMYIEDEEGQEALQQLHDMGFEIGNHTYTHANLETISEEEQYEEIVQTNDLIEEIIGEKPRFFRAPHGVNTEYSNQLVEDEDMTVLNWTYGYDWEPEYQNPEALADIMVNTELLGNGGNLLMHDREWTMQALPDIIDGLREEDYDFVDPATIRTTQDESEESI